MKLPSATILTATAMLSCATAISNLPLLASNGEPEVLRWTFEKGEKKESSRVKIHLRKAIPGEGVYLMLLRDCNADGFPDHIGYGTCRSPLDAWTTAASDRQGNLEVFIDFTEKTWKLPSNIVLWLQVSQAPAAQGGNGLLVPLRLTRDVCSLWESIADTFLGGECSTGLLHALRKHKGFDELADVLFEVRRLKLGSDHRDPVSIPNTVGATGVVWVDESTLLVAREPVEAPSRPQHPQASAVIPGLYRIDLNAPAGAAPEMLWKSEDGLIPAAPFALTEGRIAFVRQSLVGDPQADEHARAFLDVWRDGSRETQIPLPYRVHQIVATSEARDELLALSLGIRENNPIFLRIRLDTGEIDTVEYSHELYQSAMRSPTGEMSAVSFEDVSGRWGWELLLTDSSGRWIHQLAHRKGRHDLMAAWHPAGGELVYLAEVSRPEISYQ